MAKASGCRCGAAASSCRGCRAGEARSGRWRPRSSSCSSGEEVYKIDGRTRALRPGRFLLVEAGIRVRGGDSAARRDGRPVRLSRSRAVAGGGARAARPGDRGLRRRAARAAPLALRPAARRRGPRRARRWRRRSSSRSTAGAEDYLSTFASRLERLSSLKRSTRIETLQRIERARAFIHDHQRPPAHPRRRSPAQAALSRFHLSRSFAEVHGLPPLAYHRRLRLDGAARLLRDGAASPTELAERLGYASLSAFTRAFRQAYGVPPSRAQ